MILFVLLGFGSNSRDLVSYLDPDDYFASRKVDTRVENLLTLAARDPENGKDEVMQLLAIRKLTANPAQARKDARVRELLTQIAERKKGKDRLGFAQEYARRALAQLDGKPAPTVTMPKASLRADAFAWFPKDAIIVAGFDLRPVAGVPAADVSTLQGLVTKYLRRGNMNQVFEVAEKLGNVRLDRFSMAMAPDPQGGADGRPNARIYARITGKLDHRRLVRIISEEGKMGIVRQETGPDRELITTLRNGDQPPAIALVGDTEVLIAGPMNERGGPDSMALLREMLEVRAGKQRGVTSGPLAERMKKANPQTFILLAGDITKDLGFGPIGGAPGVDGKGTLPKAVVAETIRKATGVEVLLEAVMENADDAQRLADEARKAIRDAIEDAKRELQRKPDVPKEVVELVTKTMESIKTSAKGTSLSFSVHISNDVMKAVPDLLEKIGAIPGGPRPELPAPPPPPGAKKGGLQQSRLAPRGVPGDAGHWAGMSPPRLTAAGPRRFETAVHLAV